MPTGLGLGGNRDGAAGEAIMHCVDRHGRPMEAVWELVSDVTRTGE